MAPLIVGYWSIRGLGAPLRLMCEYANVGYESRLHNVEAKQDGTYDMSDWHVPKAELKKKQPLINLPYVIDDGVIVTQSNACMEYLGEKFGLMGTNPVERSECTMLLCQVKDLRDDCTGTFYPRGNDPDALGKLMDNMSLVKLENWLAAKGTTYLLGETPNAPDFHLWEMLDQLNEASAYAANKASPFSGRPNLKKLYDAFLSLPCMKSYVSSGLAGLPSTFNEKNLQLGNHGPICVDCAAFWTVPCAPLALIVCKPSLLLTSISALGNT